MKAEHRHELKTNELAQWLANLPQWIKQNLKLIVYASIVVVVAGASFALWWYYAKVEVLQQQLELTAQLSALRPTKARVLEDKNRGMDSSFNLLQLANTLQTTAQQTKSDNAAALALIKRGQALRTELHYRAGRPTAQEIANQLNQAQAAYTQALEMTQANPSLTAIAKFGLGLCAEERGQFDQAEQTYRQIAEDPNLQATIAAAAANLRLENMHEYQTVPVFKAPAKKLEPQIIRPDIKIEAPDVNAIGG